jgi:hypothetical protein
MRRELPAAGNGTGGVEVRTLSGGAGYDDGMPLCYDAVSIAITMGFGDKPTSAHNGGASFRPGRSYDSRARWLHDVRSGWLSDVVGFWVGSGWVVSMGVSIHATPHAYDVEMHGGQLSGS